ncbi:unnamed protein product [Prorocentrum cordatum]|uniref:Uncharacterized protein n=1 Tax=Prorocentrum cordatum TaxID=2364126 RepID=A0ABN9WRW4_9DINO|nr:unnamed protein product [Polarella glacialis]
MDKPAIRLATDPSLYAVMCSAGRLSLFVHCAPRGKGAGEPLCGCFRRQMFVRGAAQHFFLAGSSTSRATSEPGSSTRCSLAAASAFPFLNPPLRPSAVFPAFAPFLFASFGIAMFEALVLALFGLRSTPPETSGRLWGPPREFPRYVPKVFPKRTATSVHRHGPGTPRAS